MLNFKYTIIGAGVVGLAIARQLSKTNSGETDVLVLEKEKSFGQGISSRNSEVIHSGIYYPTGSQKHLFCVKGRQMIYAYCKEKNIPHFKCGKLVVATVQEEEAVLEGLLDRSIDNQVKGVFKISKKEALALEPEIKVHAALWLTETGIVDAHSLMKSLESDTTKNNATVAYGSTVVNIEKQRDEFRIVLADGEIISSRFLINSAGMSATDISARLGIIPEKLYPCKGVYFSYSGKHSVKHLIYPIPKQNLAGLGIHATIDLSGKLRFGPDTDYTDAIDDYSVNENRLEAFYLSAKCMFPKIEKEKMHPDMAGIRPKIQGPFSATIKDFYIREESSKGFPGYINLLGIESPGLTSCLAIAEEVCGLL